MARKVYEVRNPVALIKARRKGALNSKKARSKRANERNQLIKSIHRFLSGDCPKKDFSIDYQKLFAARQKTGSAFPIQIGLPNTEIVKILADLFKVTKIHIYRILKNP